MNEYVERMKRTLHIGLLMQRMCTHWKSQSFLMEKFKYQ